MTSATLARRPSARAAHRRTLLVWGALAAASVVIAIATLGTGEYPLSPAEVVAALTGAGDRGATFVVQELRLPRLLCALGAGAALGAAGAVFQTLTRNPLGSPDVLGFTWGAAAFAVLQIAVLGGGAAAISGSAVVGGAVTAMAVYGLSLGGAGGASGARLILVGIGVSALLAAVTAFIIARADLGAAQAARVWLTGSLNGRGWEYAVPVLVGGGALALPLALLVPALRILELGDDLATGLGVTLRRARPLLILVAVALSGVATATCGPVPFVALAAPQLARRLTGASGPGVTAAALMGAVLLAASDLAAQRILPSGGLPVGVMTGALGGTYLIWLLHHEWRRSP